MRFRTCFLAAVVAFAVAACAPRAPLPAASGLDGLIAAERAFAKLSEEKGAREAFLAYLGEDAVLFRPRPVPGLAWMRERPAPKGALLWRPDFAELSEAGDLGVTSGPWEYRFPAEAKQPPEHGHFVTVWRHRPGEGWRVAVDIGVSHPPDPAAAEGVASPPARSAASAGKDAVRTDIGGSLLAAEDELERAVASKGLAEALLDRAADDLRLYREGSVPAATRAAARAAIAPDASRPSFKVEGHGFSRSGDLGYVYGARFAQPGKEDATFFRIWRRGAGKGWQVSLDLVMPVPAGPAS